MQNTNDNLNFETIRPALAAVSALLAASGMTGPNVVKSYTGSWGVKGDEGDVYTSVTLNTGLKNGFLDAWVSALRDVFGRIGAQEVIEDVALSVNGVVRERRVDINLSYIVENGLVGQLNDLARSIRDQAAYNRPKSPSSGSPLTGYDIIEGYGR